MSTSRPIKRRSISARRGRGANQNWRNNLMDKQPSPMHGSPRCRARSKRSRQRCRSLAVNGKFVCRMHGAGGGAPAGNCNALKHGLYTASAIAERRRFAELIREAPKAASMKYDLVLRPETKEPEFDAPLGTFRVPPAAPTSLVHTRSRLMAPN